MTIRSTGRVIRNEIPAKNSTEAKNTVVRTYSSARSRRLRVQRVSQREVVCLAAAPACGLVAAPRSADRRRRQQDDRQDLEDPLAARTRVPRFLQLLGDVLVHMFRHWRGSYWKIAATMLMVTARITAPNRYPKREWSRTVWRISLSLMSVSATWNVMPIPNATYAKSR